MGVGFVGHFKGLEEGCSSLTGNQYLTLAMTGGGGGGGKERSCFLQCRLLGGLTAPW